jgi:hypothetical protein
LEFNHSHVRHFKQQAMESFLAYLASVQEELHPGKAGGAILKRRLIIL